MRPYFVVVLITALLALARGSSDITYLGCYKDSSNRILSSPQKDLHNVNSPKACAIICRSEGYTYSGVEYSYVCFCGNRKPDLSLMVESAECNSRCSGDRESFCGGTWRLQLYHTGLDDCSANITYLGCYKDRSDHRLLALPERILTTSNNPIRCANLCRLDGYSYSGVENGNACFCGNHKPEDTAKVGVSECNVPCSGDLDSFCGGSWRLQLYQTGLAISTSDMTYLGCYKDSGDRVLPSPEKNLAKTNTPNTCNDICRSQGFLYSGVEYSYACFCGNHKPEDRLKVGESECNSPCRGNKDIFCGGFWRIQVFQTGLPIITPNLTYLGCYKDSGNRVLNHPERDLLATNTPISCANRCMMEGYSYSGVEFSYACFCGNQKPGDHLRTAESDCNSPCRGDKDIFCGGFWRIQIFHTDLSISSPDISYLGCYKDSANPRLFSLPKKDLFASNSPFSCGNHCRLEGYSYSGLENGYECFCGNHRPDHHLMVEKWECNTRCSGDQESFCGGSWRLQLYHTGLDVCSPNFFYLGCYKDSPNPRLFSSPKRDLKLSNSPVKCAKLCRMEGFSYSGVENGYECFCGNHKLEYQLLVGVSECNVRCTGDRESFCGGPWRLQLYYIGLDMMNIEDQRVTTDLPSRVETTTDKPSLVEETTKQPCLVETTTEKLSLVEAMTDKPSPVATTTEDPCKPTPTLHDGKPTCAGQIIFHETFDKNQIDSDTWSHSVFIPWTPDHEFVIFDRDPNNSFIEDGILYIKPTLRDEGSDIGGVLDAYDCIGLLNTEDCQMAVSYSIRPPVQSARLHTKDTFNFRYGIIDIRAKLPVGEWIVPELRLEPLREAYGVDYSNGQIRIAMSRGNKELKNSSGVDSGTEQLESGVLMGHSDDVRQRSVVRKDSSGWYSQFHNYSLIWKPDNLEFLVDGKRGQKLLINEAPLSEHLGFPQQAAQRWKTGSVIAPFDKDFYLSVGVSVGGLRSFADHTISETGPKPWLNTGTLALLKFWKAKEKWHSTWDPIDSALQIDSITVRALG